MGYRTKIDWCDTTWNPVTGCLHGCEYCYAERMVKRFGKPVKIDNEHLHVLDRPMRNTDTYEYMRIAGISEGRKLPYPFGFEPTFHRYRLDMPEKWSEPRVIFVCSMADLFGEWVPDDWIMDVFEACGVASRHRYLFLTKNPQRYIELHEKRLLPAWDNMWFGYSATRQDQLWTFHHADDCPIKNLFVSMEPILEPIQPGFSTHIPADWVIIGAETGIRKGKVIPEKKWIDNILMECEYSGRPIFMKDSLREIMGEDFVQEFPWE